MSALTLYDTERFWAKVDRSGGADACWPWVAARIRSGYGAFSLNGRQFGAHRVSYELTCGPIRDGLWVLHRCDNRPCCNPAHLFLGTNTDNMRDAQAKGRLATGKRSGAYTKPESRQRGETNGNSRLTADQVVCIRESFAAGGHTLRQLATSYGVSRHMVYLIVHNKNWSHVGGPTRGDAAAAERVASESTREAVA